MLKIAKTVQISYSRPDSTCSSWRVTAPSLLRSAVSEISSHRELMMVENLWWLGGGMVRMVLRVGMVIVVVMVGMVVMVVMGVMVKMVRIVIIAKKLLCLGRTMFKIKSITVKMSATDVE